MPLRGNIILFSDENGSAFSSMSTRARPGEESPGDPFLATSCALFRPTVTAAWICRVPLDLVVGERRLLNPELYRLAGVLSALSG
jgi:hypothetical protein